MEFGVLGQLTLKDGERTIEITSQRQRSVLAMLLANRGHVVSTDTFIDEIWGEGAGPDRQNALWVHISNLRSALEPDRPARTDGSLIITRPPGYVLDVGAEQIDAGRFERAVSESRARVREDPAGASAALSNALELWRGRAYEEFEYERFAHEQIVHLDELRLEAVEARIEADLALGRSAELVSELETLVREHPLRERFVGQLTLALYRAGRQAEALRAYQALRRRLNAELGVEPSPEIQELERRILEEDPSLQAPPVGGHRVSSSEPGLAVRGYEIRDQIGSGPAGITHRAFQPTVGREVAITTVSAELADDPSFIRRFEEDARLVGALEHPHIVPLFDFWREPGAAYLVHRLMAGSLSDVLEDTAVETSSAVAMIEDLAAALELAHRHHVVHGDICPDVVLLDDEGRAYLSGFGLGGAGAHGHSASTAPEVRAGLPPTAASDVYGLASVVAQALAGMRGRFEQIEGALEPAIAEALGRATVTEPGQRPTAGELAGLVARAGGSEELTAASPDVPVENPYRGLAAFRAADAASFFGRQRVVDRLVNRAGRPGVAGRFAAVVGPSGSGKSSVVRAGLLPALAAGATKGSADWFVTGMTPGAHPFEALEAALMRVAVDPPPTLFEQLSAGENGLRRAVRRILPDESAQLLLVIDQFEELFTLADPAAADVFLDGLAGAVLDAQSRVRVIVTLRADFYDGPLRHRAFGELLREGTEVITPMSPEELEEAIVRPVEPMGISFAPAVVAEMVREVAGRPGALPLLQFTLTELFDQRTDLNIGMDSYRSIGGVSGALASRAEELIVGTESVDADAARQVFLRLVTLGEGVHDTRRRALKSELDDLELPPAAIKAVLDGFSSRRLLTLDRDPVTRGPTVEISHEALLGEWQRLRQWIDGAREDVRNQRRLAAAVAEWNAAGGSEDHLLTGGVLDRIAAWAGDSSVTLGSAEREFLDGSVVSRDRLAREEEEREAQREAAEASASRRLRVTAGAVAVAALVGALAVVALLQARAAEQSEDELAATLRSQDLAAASVLELRTDLDLAARVAMEAARATADLGVITPEAMDALHWVVQESNLVYPADDETPVAVRPGPRGATGVYYLAPDELVALAQSAVTGPFSAEQCAELFPAQPCPDPRAALPDGLALQGGEAAYGVVPQGPAALAGTRVEILSAVTADDLGFFLELERFEEKTGIVVSSPVGVGPEFELERRPGDLEPEPDIVFWPQPALVAGQPEGSMIDLSAYLDVDLLRQTVGPRLVSLGTVGADGAWPADDGALVGLPIDVDVKGLVFYPRQRFEEAGYRVPESWDELLDLSNRMVADGRTPWCFNFGSGPASGWPGTDLIETMVAREGGVDLYDAWTRHEVPFDHPVVVSAARKVEQLLLTEGYARGGRGSISRFQVFTEGVTPLLQDQPECWLYHQADWAMTLAPADVVVGRDLDAFPFPPLEPGQPVPATGGGQILSVLGDRPEVRAFAAAAAAPTWGEAWASPQASGFISPNAGFDVDAYASDADEEARSFRRTVGTLARDAIAADLWRFDASDLMPGPIGSIEDGAAGAFWVGMLDVVDGRRSMAQVLTDIEAEWQRLDAE